MKDRSFIPVTLKLFGRRQLLDGRLYPDEQSKGLIKVVTNNGESKTIKEEDIEVLTMLGMEISNPYRKNALSIVKHFDSVKTKSLITNEEMDAINKEVLEEIKKYKDTPLPKSIKKSRSNRVKPEPEKILKGKPIDTDTYDFLLNYDPQKLNILLDIVQQIDSSEHVIYSEQKLQNGKRITMFFRNKERKDCHN